MTKAPGGGEARKKRVSTSHTARSLIHNLMIISPWEAKLMEQKCKSTGRCRQRDANAFLPVNAARAQEAKLDRWQLFGFAELAL